MADRMFTIAKVVENHVGCVLSKPGAARSQARLLTPFAT
jgi:hypothetical protein